MTKKPLDPKTPLTGRQEAFCQKIAEGSTQFEAYTSAGYKAASRPIADAQASALVRIPKVAARIAELQRQNAKLMSKTVATLVADLDDALAIARTDRNPAAMATAVMAQARLLGMIVDRQQVQVEHSLKKPSADEHAPAEMDLSDWASKYGGGSFVGNANGNGKLIEHEH